MGGPGKVVSYTVTLKCDNNNNNSTNKTAARVLLTCVHACACANRDQSRAQKTVRKGHAKTHLVVWGRECTLLLPHRRPHRQQGVHWFLLL